jgi:hypothetical protein
MPIQGVAFSSASAMPRDPAGKVSVSSAAPATVLKPTIVARVLPS